MAHEDLESYFKVNFALVQHHKYSISDIENLIPFERDIYVQMLIGYLRELEEQKRKQNG